MTSFAHTGAPQNDAHGFFGLNFLTTFVDVDDVAVLIVLVLSTTTAVKNSSFLEIKYFFIG
jgi:hypothetical protein